MVIKDISNDKKPWDEHHIQLFHRIQSDQFNKNRAPASGKAYDCGARSPAEDFLPSGLTSIIAHQIVNAIDTALTGLLTLIPVVGAALALFKETAEKFLEKEIKQLKEDLANLIATTGEGALFGRFLRSLPAWVPVDRVKFGPDFNNSEKKEVEREVEGRLTGSYQSPRDIPFFQWNHWYCWAFHVTPIQGYGYMLGEGNRMNASESDALIDGDNPKQSATDINEEQRGFGLSNIELHSMACLWDMGAFCKRPGNFGDKQFHLAGMMFHPDWPFWPTCGDYFWASGRWVYDCTHTTSMEKKGPNPGLMPTQLHPCKAIAFARYEGFKFPENEKHVPAVRFQFLAGRQGGYINFRDKDETEKEDTCAIAFNDKDYVFIVDLPEAPASDELEWPIGHTPQFPANTLVLRPSLLMDVQIAPYKVPDGLGTAFFDDALKFEKSLQPKIELLKPQDPKKPRQQQVKITVPLSQVDKSKNAYGFCVSLGWFDPTGELGNRVKKVNIRWDHINFTEDFDKVRLNLGVNGRWVVAPLEDVEKDTNISLAGSDPRFTQFVPDDSKVSIAIHGIKLNGFGRFMEQNNDQDRKINVGGIFRTPKELQDFLNSGEAVLNLGNMVISSDFIKDLSKEAKDLLVGERKVVEWKKHVDQANNAVASAVAREMFAKLPPLFNDQNDMVGMVEPNSVGNFGFTINGNPVEMKKLIKNMSEGQSQLELTSQTLQMVVGGDADKLMYLLRGGRRDYELLTVLNVADQ